MSSRRVSQLKAIVETEGFRVMTIQRAKNGHYKITMSEFDDGLGEIRVIQAAASPSDHRYDLNLRRDIRRAFREGAPV